MALGTALLQPQAFRVSAADPEAALIEDITRLAALFGEDAAADGPMAGAAHAAILDLGPRIEDQFKARLATAQARLRTKLTGPRNYLDRLAADAAAAASDAGRIIGLFRRVAGDLQSLVGSLTLPGIRQQLEFFKTIVETDLGLGPVFLAETTRLYLDQLRTRVAAIELGGDLALARRRRLAVALLARLSVQLASYRPPGIDVEAVARLIDRLLRETGLGKALREISCALEGIEKSLAAAEATGKAVRPSPQPIGAGVVTRTGAIEYSWYASWLLSDEDVFLLGFSDIKKPRDFVTRLQAASNPLTAFLREQFSASERAVLDSYTNAMEDPSRAVMLTVLAVVNRAMQRQTILEPPEGDARLPSNQLTEEIRKLRLNHVADQELLLFNRRVLELAFKDVIEEESGWFSRKVRTIAAGVAAWPRNQVYVTGDRRFVMCGDKPMIIGENLHWYDAPMFSEFNLGMARYIFEHFKPETCEVLAQILTTAGEAGKSIWHIVDNQPGHAANAGVTGSIEIADTIQQILFGNPLSGYFVEKSGFVRKFGNWLDSGVGLKGVGVLATSFEDVIGRDDNNLAAFWLTVFLGDAIRTAGPAQTVNGLRDIILAFVTLANFRGPQDAPSSLPRHPAANHLKQGPFVSLADTLFAMLSQSLYPRDNYSIFIWDFTKDGIGGRQVESMLGHWIGGSAGLGLLAGLSGSFVAQVIAWSEDFPRFFLTGAKSAGKMAALFWLYNYLFKENDTDGGRYRPGGGSFRGYPPRDSSPYRLPYPGGTALYAGQANLGLFSHNFITNSDLVTPANGAPQQAYAYDFSHEFREPIACVRGGVVWSFTENLVDSNTANWNVLIIRHATIDPVHDNFGSGPVQTYSVYGHLAQNGVRNAPLFGGAPPGQESVAAGTGAAVNRGDLIALAGDTGMSFHNHLHLHIVPDTGGGMPDLSANSRTIPFVFGDAPGDGNLKSITWYRSGNA